MEINGPIKSSASAIETVDKHFPESALEKPSFEPRAFLQPPKAPSPDSRQQTIVETGHVLRQQASFGERYPTRVNTTKKRQDSQHQPIISRYSQNSQELREGKSSTPTQKSLHSIGAPHVSGSLSDPFASAVGTAMSHHNVENDQNLSAAAAALEKSASETRVDQTPRQTRTSSLRARLSAGQLVKDSHNKVLGFTDFTVSRASSDSMVNANRGDSLSIRKEPHIHRSRNDLNLPMLSKGSKPSLQKKTSMYSLRSNISTESLVKGHAPAQFVGGSRRSIPYPRSMSRNNNRQASQESNSIMESRQAKTLPPLPGTSIANDRGDSTTETEAKVRKSSLPVPTYGALKAMSKPNGTTATDQKATQVNVTPKKLPRNEKSAQRDRSSEELISVLEGEAKLTAKHRGAAQIFNDAQEYRSLMAIEESPQHAFTLKRLSVKAPEYGPKLRISPSAERFIMGSNSDKENQVVPGKSSKRFFLRTNHGIHRRQQSGSDAGPTFRRRPDRPVSSHGALQSSPRVPNFDPEARARKVRSADMSSTVSTLSTSSTAVAATHDPSRQNTGASKQSKVSSTDQSFVSAQEESSQHVKHDYTSTSPRKEQGAVVDEAAWISGSKEKVDESFSDSTSINSSVLNSQASPSRKDTPPGKDPVDSPPKARNADADSTITPTRSASDATVKQMPFTPLDTIGKMSSRPSRRHPPRSSSRVAHPDFTASPSPPKPVAEDMASSTPQIDENRQENIQNRLGSRSGHTSWHVDIAELESKRISSLRDTLIQENPEPVSTPLPTKKSFSSFRNLFNKRTSTPDPSMPKPNSKDVHSNSSTKAKQPKNKTKKGSIASSSSPNTPILSKSKHSSQRPTLASSIRATPSPHKSTPPINTSSPASRTVTTTPATTAATPISLASPTSTPISISASTNLAMTLLEAARNEQSFPKQKKLVQMSEILVNAVTEAREAEKAAEEARMASRRADMAKQICENMVVEVGRIVGEWSDSFMQQDGLAV